MTFDERVHAVGKKDFAERLDAILEDPDLVWLGTGEEKSTHLTTLLRNEPADRSISHCSR